MVSYQNNTNAGRATSSASHAGRPTTWGAATRSTSPSTRRLCRSRGATHRSSITGRRKLHPAERLGQRARQLRVRPACWHGPPALHPDAEGNLHANRHGELQLSHRADPDRYQPLFIHRLRPADRHGWRLQQGETRKPGPGEVQPRRLQGTLQTTQMPLCRGEA
jgi:hypothetical protein